MDHVEYMRLLRSGPIEKELPFTQEEYDERVAKVQGGDGERRAGWADSGLAGELALSIGVLHVFDLQPDGSRDTGGRGTGRRDGVVRDTCGDPIGVGGGCGQFLPGTKAILIAAKVAGMLEARGLGGKRLGIEMARGGPIPGLIEELGRAVPNASFVDASGLVERVRKIKSATET